MSTKSDLISEWIAQNENFIRHIIASVVGVRRIDDYLSIAYLTILKRWDDYDPERGKERTFFGYYIRFAVMNEMRKNRLFEATVLQPHHLITTKPITTIRMDLEDRLSPQELELLTHLEAGKSMVDYSRSTGLSYDRVRMMVRNIRTKTKDLFE